MQQILAATPTGLFEGLVPGPNGWTAIDAVVAAAAVVALCLNRPPRATLPRLWVLRWLSRCDALRSAAIVLVLTTLVVAGSIVAWLGQVDGVRDVTNALYRALTLLTFGADWTLPPLSETAKAHHTPIPWYLDAARLVLPLLAILSIIVLVVRRLAYTVQLQLMPQQGHTVLCGLGQAGLAYIRHLESWSAYRKHAPIVVIECDPDNPNVAYCRSIGIPVIVGDASSADHAALRRARCAHARRVVGLLREDKENVELVLRVQQHLEQARPGDPTGRVHIIAQVNAPQLARRLEYYEKISQYSKADVRFHNIHAIQAQQFILRYPPESYADLFGQAAPHFTIYGFGRLGQQVFAEAVRLRQYMTGVAPVFTIVDRAPERVRRLLHQEFPEIMRPRPATPALAVVREIVGHEIAPPMLTEEVLTSILQQGRPVTQHVICFDDEEMAMALALALRDQLIEREYANAPIFVRTKGVRDMAALLDSSTNAREIPDGLFPFAGLEHALDPDALDNGWVEDLAQALHLQGYLRTRKPSSQRPADQSWSNLDDVHRRGNRLAALHLDIKLRAAGLKRFPEHGGQPDPDGPPPIPEAAREPLAGLEHRRYVAARLADGWQLAEQRVDALRRHTVLRPYEELDDDFRDNDRILTRILPALTEGNRALTDAFAKPSGELRSEPPGAAPAVHAPAVDAPAVDADDREARDLDREADNVMERLAARRQRVRSLHRIAVIGPLGPVADARLEESAAPLCTQAGQWLQQTSEPATTGGDGTAAPARETCLRRQGVELVSPMVHAWERAVVRHLWTRIGDGAAGDPETFWARRANVVGVLPLPYDFMREQPGFFLHGDRSQRHVRRSAEEERRFCELLGRAEVSYVEMPLRTAAGVDLAVREPDRDPEAVHALWQLQWELTAAYLIPRCQEIVLLRGPAGWTDGLDRIAAWAEDPAQIPSRLATPPTGLHPVPKTPKLHCFRSTEPDTPPD